MKDVDAAWLAAAIDGEGTITVTKRKNKIVGDGYSPKITIGNNCEEFVEKARRIIGHGGIYSRKYEIRGESRITYQFNVGSRGVILLVLKEILPYLIVKKNNAEKIIAWLESNGSKGIVLEHSSKSISARNASNENNFKKGNRDCGNIKSLYAKGYTKNIAMKLLNENKDIFFVENKCKHDLLKGWRGHETEHAACAMGRHH